MLYLRVNPDGSCSPADSLENVVSCSVSFRLSLILELRSLSHSSPLLGARKRTQTNRCRCPTNW